MEEVTISFNLAYMIFIGILCIITLLLAIYFDQKKLIKTRQDNFVAPPKHQFVASKSGRVLVSTPKRKMIVNDDGKIYLREQEEKNNGSRES